MDISLGLLAESRGVDPPPASVGMRESITFQAVVSTAEGADSAEVQTLRANRMGLWSKGGNKIASLTTVSLEFEDTDPLIRIFRPRGVGRSVRLLFPGPHDCNTFVKFFNRLTFRFSHKSSSAH